MPVGAQADAPLLELDDTAPQSGLNGTGKDSIALEW